jgi:50S ribosomal subunit-associated GTPase HflX
MDQPLLRRTVLGSGKVREVAATVQQTGAELVVFTNALTDHQRAVLTEELGARVISADEWEGS